MLEIIDLHARIDEREILRGVSLKVNPGEVHAIMGPNGSGKSTLASVIAGKSDYEVTSGDILVEGESILEMAPEERAAAGLFLAFQYPVEIPGVSNLYFLRASYNAIQKANGKPEMDALKFMNMAKDKAKLLDLDTSFFNRGVNEGFSGGEKKRNEIFQMAVLEPRIAVLDETDSGLDIDALKAVSDGVNALRASDRGFLVITHYQRLLNHIVPDFVHILMDGRIVKSGDKSLALELEAKGYGWLENDLAAGSR
ncbi:MAG: Fe-S cluster assembly ATPase SufC [Chthonomonas sp.]|nr:Fe-S cluster assembly ATPase SufC [Chthonomonas sp.]